jgi:hypothetical protein
VLKITIATFLLLIFLKNLSLSYILFQGMEIKVFIFSYYSGRDSIEFMGPEPLFPPII